MNYFERLLFLRKVLRLNQAQMGHIIDVPQTTYSNYEKGLREIPLEKVQILTQFGISSDWLLTGSINENHSYELVFAMQNTGTTSECLAKKLGVPVIFLNAIQEKTISPSIEFFTRAIESMGCKPHGALLDARKEEDKKFLPGGSKNHYLTDFKSRIQNEPTINDFAVSLGAAYVKIDKLTETIIRLEFENKSLKTDVEELKKQINKV